MGKYSDIVRNEVFEAENRIRDHILTTPVEHSRYLSKVGNCDVYLKLENQQKTRSFKLRGALNKVLSLSEEQRERGIISASSGNNGAAVAYLLGKFDFNGTIFLPSNVSKAKIEALKLMGAHLELHGTDCVEAENMARRTAETRGLTFISPYNDLKIIGGQGTIGLELERQLDQFDAVIAPIGGGGLISGVAGYLKSSDREVGLFGCQPFNSPVMYESVKAGRIIEMESKPTISDGTSGGIEAGSVTFDICMECVDDILLVDEDQIVNAIRLLLEYHHILVEGAGALSTASFLKNRERFEGKTVVLIISGAKISMETLRKVIG